MSERTRLHYPTVYVVHTEDKNRYKSVPDYTVYVGETNSIRNRTSQHLKTDSNVREDWKDFADLYSRMLLPRGSMLLLMGISTSR